MKIDKSQFVFQIKRVYCLCMLLVFGYTCSESFAQLIEGNVERCDNEGEVMNVPLLTDNPCFSCVCKGGSIQCSREVCPINYPCSHLLEKKGKCCKQCFGCSLDGLTYEHDQIWFEVDQEQKRFEHVCKDGVITRKGLECHVSCDRPLAPPSGGFGCQVCKGCIHAGVQVLDGESFNPSPCVRCTCTAGFTECRKTVCPVLVCEIHKRRLDDDGCCMKCQGEKLLFELVSGGCWFRRGFLENGEEITIDPCTACVCRNGTIVCEREVCPTPLGCPEKDLIRVGCCPRCPAIRYENCTDSYGNVVKHGETWRDSRDPCRHCSCRDGEIACDRQSCAQRTCPKGEVMDKLPGTCCPTCQSEPGVCSVFGDPHYRSFDGRAFNFQGDCRYVLAKDCLGKNFSVVVENNAKRSPLFSWTNSVHLKIFRKGSGGALRVSLYQRLVVKVNNRKVSLPFVSAHVIIWLENHVVKVRTNAGVSLNWDGDSFLEVGAAAIYRGTLCGLCGNFNGYARDDFMGRDGVFKFEKSEFAKSWRVGAKGEHCTRRQPRPRSVEPCGHNVRLRVLARRTCQPFKSRQFRKCYSRVDPFDYYRACLMDSCECPRTRKCSCESIRAYASACFRQGVKLEWDEAYHCKRPCSHGKVYTTCGSPCKVKCKNIFYGKRIKCRRACSAGCFCPAGYALRGRKCVKISKCYSKRLGSRRKRKFRHGNPLQRYLKT